MYRALLRPQSITGVQDGPRGQVLKLLPNLNAGVVKQSGHVLACL
ncbi:hypothetical protein SAMN05660657_04397 [Geodermatophilus amargosae]|uniref:Uncharacterized protein n=1 Tax=Geodermatophilus amargosae TaxID=1296565 RepID=A0A1I7CFD0_9ACTN|nr:hypothetical protein SAMN05660657_04397 [Geodermatophilus amargosae]